ncbi:MAG: aminotransferase class I/II-fold pyridoxal phosphate-dependent enzyme [Bacteroidetes bacterium]|nr:aminotransferase class I/II-fold pyridoxal phosphate-dependent enzyme [Bacteroidota bacterium]
MTKHGFSTNALHGGDTSFQPDSMSTPIYQSVAYPFFDAVEAAAISSGQKPGFTYGRWDNPTVQVFEKRMAVLEHTEAAIAAASGMSATFLLTHHLVGPGDNVVSSNRVYGGTFGLFNVGLPRMGANINWVTNPESIEAWEAAITPRTKFIFVETPSNPALFIADIPALAALAKSKNLPLVVDNTIATPALQQPVLLGADIVVHSTTKYICGNATALGGIVCGSHELIDGIRQNCIRYLGPAMAPFNAWLNLLGLETLALRMDRHCQNALAVAKFFEKHPKVSLVNYPGLESNPYHKMIKPQMKGCSSLMSIELKGTYEQATRFIDSLLIITHATHLGTCRSIVTHPASTTHAAMGEEEMRKAGISPSMIRFSIGIEDEADLINDLAQAFDAIDKKAKVKEDFTTGKYPQAY